jgi:hypothetical protein
MSPVTRSTAQDPSRPRVRAHAALRGQRSLTCAEGAPRPPRRPGIEAVSNLVFVGELGSGPSAPSACAEIWSDEAGGRSIQRAEGALEAPSAGSRRGRCAHLFRSPRRHERRARRDEGSRRPRRGALLSLQRALSQLGKGASLRFCPGWFYTV